MEYRGIVMSVDFVGTNEFSDVIQIPSDISWADFELVLHLQFNCNDLDVKYIDEEGDQITLSSHEELVQAIEVAKQNNNTLHLKVYSKCESSCDNSCQEAERHGDHLVPDAVPCETGPKKDDKPAVTTCPEERESEEDAGSSDSNGHEEKEGNSDECRRRERPVRYYGPDLVKRKKKKLDYFAYLAQDMGRLRKPYHDTRPKRLHHETEQQHQENTYKDPPRWFTEYMAKFKQEIIADVTNKVLKQRNVQNGAGGATCCTTVKENIATYCHTGIVCDNCEKVIQGVRYKCGNCVDFDLCEPCERSGVTHDESHLFVKISRPLNGIGRKDSGKMKPILKKFVSEQTKHSHKKLLPAERKILRIKKLEKKLTKTQEKLHALLPDPNDERQHYLDLDNVRQFRSPYFGKYNAIFVQDVTYPDGCHVYVGQKFTKCWTVRNTGLAAWPHDTKLKLLWGNLMCEHTEVPAPSLKPDTEGTVSVELMAPPKPGTYQSHWRLHSSSEGFGHRLWCHVVVDDLPPDNSQDSSEQPASEQTPAPEAVENAAAVCVSTAIENAVACCKQESEDGSVKIECSTDTDDKGSVSGSSSVGVEADLLSAKNILSSENLEVEKRTVPLTSQTATPNNTPMVTTPPNERTPSSSELSRRSSIELVEPEDCQGEMTELVRKKISDLAIQTDGVGSSLSRSSSVSSLSTENDFYVVPLPDCFNLDKPMSRSLLKTQSSSGDEGLNISTANSASELTVTESETDPVDRASASTDEDLYQANQDPILEVKVDEEAVASNEQADEQNDLSGHFTNESDNTVQESSDEENTDSGSADSEQTELKVDLGAAEASAAAAAAAAEAHVDDWERQYPHSPTEIASKLASNVIGVTSHVATKAFTAAKDIFHHLQAQEQYVPPQPAWTPPQNTWTPTPTAWSPQVGQWQDRVEEDMSPMDKLIDMGFGNRAENQRLLDKHGNDVQKVLQDLLDQDVENDWHQIRH